MKSVNIKLSLAENVKSFVNIVNRYPYDVDLRAGRHVVDAKSILGIFSLDLSKPITLASGSVVRIRLARLEPMKPDEPVINTVLANFFTLILFSTPSY